MRKRLAFLGDGQVEHAIQVSQLVVAMATGDVRAWRCRVATHQEMIQKVAVLISKIIEAADKLKFERL